MLKVSDTTSSKRHAKVRHILFPKGHITTDVFDGMKVHTSDTDVFISAYNGDLTSALADIGGDNRRLVINQQIVIDSDITIPSNCTVSIVEGGSFDIASGKTLTINRFDFASAGMRECFTGDGSVVFAADSVQILFSQWFDSGDIAAEVIYLSGASPLWIKENGEIISSSMTATPTAGKIPIADGSGKLNGWVDSSTPPDASETVKGIVELATDAEAAAKTSTDKALVPSNLPTVLASPGDIGITTPGKVYASDFYLDGDAPGDTPTEVIKWYNGRLAVGVGAKTGGGVYQDILAVGYEALGGGNCVGDAIVGVGSYALWSITSGNEDTAVGAGALGDNTTGSYNVGFGNNAGNNNVTGSKNTCIGSSAAKGVASNSYSDNTAVGYKALYAVTTGGKNVVVGSEAGDALTTQETCTYVGYQAGKGSTGLAGTSLGAYALSTNTGDGNTAIGINAAAVASGDNNVAIGNNALNSSNTSGSDNVVVGNSAFYQGATLTGGRNVGVGTAVASQGPGAASDNVLVGYHAGYAVTGNQNTLVGSGAGDSITTGAGNIIIGYNQDASTATVNNEINIGGTLYGVIGEGIGVRGSTGGLRRWFKEATANITADTSVTITLNIPSGARILGVQLRVDAALATGELWDAAYSGGSTVAITTAAAVSKNTKVSTMFNTYAATDITTNTTNIAITKNGGGTFTAQGTIRAIVYYEAFDTMADAA